ncbi:MAG: S41 family peptidase [Bdellovibrio sp.]
MKIAAIISASLLLLSACNSNKELPAINSAPETAIRPLTQDERASDFDQLLELFKTYYGPYHFKEKRFGFSIEKTILDLKAQALAAKTDEEFMGYIMKVSSAFHDGHVQFVIENSASNIMRYKIPINLYFIEGKAIVAAVDDEFSKWSGIKKGDEVLSVDGKTPTEILQTILQYRQTAEELSNKANIIFTFLRPSYMTDLIPAGPSSSITVKAADGTVSTVEAPWEKESYSTALNGIVRPKGLSWYTPFAEDFNATVKAHRGQMGQVNPIFLNSTTQEKYKFVQVFPSSESLKKEGLKGDEKPGIYAALYKHSGKTILLLRSSTYSPTDYSDSVYMKTYAALIKEYQDLADVMVLDQTHNPGGSFCADFYNLFAKENDIQAVEQVRADRKWVNDLYITWPKEGTGPDGSPWDIKLLQTWGAVVEKAYDNGDFLAEPFALFTGTKYTVRKSANWSKPMLVLIDELAGSCGDLFPMLVKANKRAQLFGQKTMGLGGNVEEVGQLNHSRVKIRMTRGLYSPYHPDGKYVETDFVENNGVAPDIQYSHTVEDFRNDFTDYVKQFSDKAVELVK